MVFLRMVRLKERRLEWAFRQKENKGKNKELAHLCGIGIRRFQQLYHDYKMTGKIPKLQWNRRPQRLLTEEEKVLVDSVMRESRLHNAVAICLYLQKYGGRNIPRNKIHHYLLTKGISQEDKKKQKQRKYCRYERDHSFSLVHMDWHESKVMPGKHVCSVIDDASRLILAGGEFDQALEEHSIMLLTKAMQVAWTRYAGLIREVNTDKGSQFYANYQDERGEKAQSQFELFLEAWGIKHITSRRNHPQTNGKQERWFRTYEERRGEFTSFPRFIEWYNHRIHLGLSRKEGITPQEAVLWKLQPEAMLGLFMRRFDQP